MSAEQFRLLGPKGQETPWGNTRPGVWRYFFGREYFYGEVSEYENAGWRIETRQVDAATSNTVAK